MPDDAHAATLRRVLDTIHAEYPTAKVSCEGSGTMLHLWVDWPRRATQYLILDLDEDAAVLVNSVLDALA